uniref:Uncharacterized protein n=1 Tax=Meloidogyne hapla TaxID=6305 RepID=A0A1I8BWN5_MELHA
MRGGDDRILSRHLASDRPTGSFRGNSENIGSGGNSFFDGLHPNRNSMGNSSLRRSMPSVNDNEKILKNNKEEKGGGEQLNTNRHMSFCLDPEIGERKIADELGALAFGGNKKENNKSEKIRCASAHSFNSLTPSSSAVFTTNYSEHSNTAPALDTKQIEFFLSKREDSRTTITTTLSDEVDNLNESQLKQTNVANIHQQRSFDQTFSPHSSKTSGGGNNNILRNSQKIFKSADTRSSIFSVSSSVDSTKEEKIISNFEHTPTTISNRIVVLPRPYNHLTRPPPFHPETSNVLVNKETNEEKEIVEISERSSSAEHQRLSPTSSQNPPLDRRPSIDLKPSNSNRDNPIDSQTTTNLHLSSWHSVSDFQNINKIINKNTNKNLLKTITSTNSIKNNNNNNNNEIWRSPPTTNRPQSQSGIRRSNYLGAIVWQVDETVYCGGIEAALNQNLLCRLNIEYIVDLSGHEDDPALANTRQLKNKI